MVRIIVVIDVELQKQDQIWREKVMKTVVLNLLEGKTMLGQWEIKKTHMHGFRLVIKNQTDLLKIMKNSENVPDEEKIRKLEFETHSTSDYASIFFVQWPMTKLNILP